MTALQSKKLVLNLLDEIATTKKVSEDTLLHAFHPDFKFHVSFVPYAFKGINGIKFFLNEVFTKAFPDIRLTVDDVVAQRNKVSVRLTAKGIQRGELFNLSPSSGKSSTICMMTIWHLEDNKIKETWTTDTYFWPHPEC